MRSTFLSSSLLLLSLSASASGAQVGAKPVLSVPSHPSQETDPGRSGATGATKAGPSAALSPDYRIGPDDVLQVTVWKEPTLSGSFPVRPDGMISLVLLGDVAAAGVTPMDLSSTITERLKKYIQDPLVTVTVTAVNSQKVYVLGEVQKVGPVELSPSMSPLQAIAAAGGLSAYANAKKSYILRGEPGKQKKIPFNYKKALKGDNSESVTLQSGDTVVVP